MKKNGFRKLAAVVATIITIATVSQLGVTAAWKQNSKGWWNTEGNAYSTGWRNINGNWYNFGSDGYMKTGWVKDKGTWYYLNSAGAMKTGWAKDNGAWYYLQPSGAMKTGWVKDNGAWYYLQLSGEMKTGWVKDSGAWYYLNSSGAMKTGWVYDNGTWYFTNSSGTMQTGVIEVDGKVYSLSLAGAMQTGKVVIDGVTYTFDKSGAAIGDKIPTSVLRFTSLGELVNKETFQEIIDTKYNDDTQFTLNDYNTEGTIKPVLNFIPGTENVTIDGQDCIVTKDLYVSLNGKDAYVEGNLESGYTVTGTGTIEVKVAISVLNAVTGKLYYVTSTPISFEK